MSKQEVRRQAKLHLVGSSGRRTGKAPEPRHRRVNAQGEPVHRLRGPQGTRGATRHREVERGSGRSQEPGSPQGARDGSRLQKSVRRIFPVLYERARRKPRSEREEAG